MADRMFRYRVSVNDEPHQFELSSDPLHVEAGRWGVHPQGPHFVDFWTINVDGAPQRSRSFQVFGTGQPLPEDAKYIGTTARTDEGAVWHLFELAEEES